MQITLSPELEKFIKSKVTSGFYADEADVIRDALRRFLQADKGGDGVPQNMGGSRGRRLGRLALPPGGGGSAAGGPARSSGGGSDAGGVAMTNLDDLPALAAMPVTELLPPLLDILEEVQIEGADVMPEVEQSLDQINAAIGNVDGVQASLAPTPDKVPEVKAAMTEANTNLKRQLDEF